MTAAAAVSARARQDVIYQFKEATAFSAESAIAFTPDRRLGRRWFDRLQRHDVIRSATPGLYYLDQAALEQERSREAKDDCRPGGALGVVAALGLLQ